MATSSTYRITFESVIVAAAESETALGDARATAARLAASGDPDAVFLRDYLRDLDRRAAEVLRALNEGRADAGDDLWGNECVTHHVPPGPSPLDDAIAAVRAQADDAEP